MTSNSGSMQRKSAKSTNSISKLLYLHNDVILHEPSKSIQGDEE